MSSKSRKRSRAVTDENRADCPFAVTILPDPARDERDVHKAKKRRHDSPGSDRRVLVQSPPFEPAGRFRTHDSMRMYYAVEPRKHWLDMTRYNSFVLNGVKYYTDDFVYVANEATIERQNALQSADYLDIGRRANEFWVARILEIRASDEHHVYARVYWMYWPEELPSGTLEGRKTMAGRQPYHGQHELVASNHMDVINVVSVVMGLKVKHWIEADDDDIQEGLYWRQAFDCRASELSSVDLVCKCLTPANPDKTLVGCTNSKCEKWMHNECLLDDILTRLYERLGTDTPHKSEKPVVKEEKEDEMETDSLSSTTAKVKEEDSKSSPVDGDHEIKDKVVVKQDDDDDNSTKTTQTPPPVRYSQLSADKSKSTSGKRGRRKKAAAKKPYEGLFEATLKMNDGPTVWRITDLRKGIQGGEKTWTEDAHCLLCDAVID